MQVSEGLDFVDKNGRAVVITGIPYAPAKDPKIVMKKSYLDQQQKTNSQKHVSVCTFANWGHPLGIIFRIWPLIHPT